MIVRPTFVAFLAAAMWLSLLASPSPAADALAAVGQPAISAVSELLKMLAKGPSTNDPRGMEQRYLCFALCDPREGLIGRSLSGVDRRLLAEAVCAGLQNNDDHRHCSQLYPLLDGMSEKIARSP